MKNRERATLMLSAYGNNVPAPKTKLPFNVHKTPESVEEKEELLRIVASQAKELISVVGIKVTCPCKKRVNLYYHAYKCFFCGVIFCGECAKEHFGEKNAKEQEKGNKK